MRITRSDLTARIPIVDGESALVAGLTRWPLLGFGIGAIVGAGIFVILGVAIPKAGPAIIVSFALAGFAAALSAFSYAELSSKIHASGGAFSYTYAVLGEGLAWAVGWMVILEYGVGVAAVAVGWGAYLNAFLETFGWGIPTALSAGPASGGLVNLPAVFVVATVVLLLLRGASESAKVNTIMVGLKLSILLFFSVVAFTQFDVNNLVPFAPLGVMGIAAAAGQVFFSYIGFDAVATAGAESRNPRKDLPFAIIGSVIVVTTLYIVVALAAIGAVRWDRFSDLDVEAALSGVVNSALGSTWAGGLIATGAVISIFSVILVVLFALSRVLFSVSRAGLLPAGLAKVNRRHVPQRAIVISGACIAVVAGFLPLSTLAETVSIGTLGAFACVNVAVLLVRRRHPELNGYQLPLWPILPVLGLIAIAAILSGLSMVTWIIFAVWMTVGGLLYLSYGHRHSNLRGHGSTRVERD